jgi:hypothetical protein
MLVGGRNDDEALTAGQPMVDRGVDDHAWWLADAWRLGSGEVEVAATVSFAGQDMVATLLAYGPGPCLPTTLLLPHLPI